MLTLSGLSFFDDHEHVLSHVMRYNPHPEGSSRDALTYGVRPQRYLWTKETEKIPLDIFEEVECVGDFWQYYYMIEKGSLPPAIVLQMYPSDLLMILDGAHRVKAAQKYGLKEIDAYIGIEKERG